LIGRINEIKAKINFCLRKWGIKQTSFRRLDIIMADEAGWEKNGHGG